jgi:hypothetical protein
LEISLLGIPLLVLAIAWVQYSRLDRSPAQNLLRIQMGLGSLSVATMLWLATFSLMIAEDYSARAKRLAQNVSPAPLALMSILLCIGAFACSRFPGTALDETVQLRRVMDFCSIFLGIVWLFLLMNPH